MSPIGTDVQFAAANGVNADFGQIQARDLYVVSAKAGGPAAVGGTLINNGSAPVTVSVVSQAQNDSANGAVAASATNTVTVPAGGSTRLAGKIAIPTLAAAPGAMTNIVFHTPDGQTLVYVPVLPQAGEYATVTAPTAPTTLPPAGTPTAPSFATTGPAATTPAAATSTAG